MQVEVEEREPPLVLSEAELAKGMPRPLRDMRGQGALLSALDAQSLRAAFVDAAIPRQSMVGWQVTCDVGFHNGLSHVLAWNEGHF